MRPRVLFCWITFALGLCWLVNLALILAGVPRWESSYMVFAFGFGYAMISPSLVGWINRRAYG